MANVVLVDEKDNQIGVEEKLAAHKKGLLHRAFSIFIFNSKGQLMLQRREFSKYHSGGLWTNTCCSHPNPEETIIDAAHRRLKEEMGFDTELKEAFSFIYKEQFDNGLTEHEFDHILIGKHENDPVPNKEEACDWKWIDKNELIEDLKNNPENYTYWLRTCHDELMKVLKGLLPIT